jgi:hypothetical protein
MRTLCYSFVLLGLVFVFGCGNDIAEKRRRITEVIQHAGQIANDEAKTPRSLREKYWNDSDRVMRVINQFRLVDLTGCPEDFQDAYLAWVRSLADFRNKMSTYKVFRGLINATSALVAGQYSWSEPGRVQNQALREIGKTYDHLTKVSLKYGVKEKI